MQPLVSTYEIKCLWIQTDIFNLDISTEMQANWNRIWNTESVTPKTKREMNYRVPLPPKPALSGVTIDHFPSDNKYIFRGMSCPVNHGLIMVVIVQSSCVPNIVSSCLTTYSGQKKNTKNPYTHIEWKDICFGPFLANKKHYKRVQNKH